MAPLPVDHIVAAEAMDNIVAIGAGDGIFRRNTDEGRDLAVAEQGDRGLLGAGLSSVSMLVTVALLVTAPVTVGRTTIVTVVLSPLPRVPRSQVTTPPDSAQTSLGITETKRRRQGGR